MRQFNPRSRGKLTQKTVPFFHVFNHIFSIGKWKMRHIAPNDSSPERSGQSRMWISKRAIKKVKTTCLSQRTRKRFNANANNDWKTSTMTNQWCNSCGEAVHSVLIVSCTIWYGMCPVHLVGNIAVIGKSDRTETTRASSTQCLDCFLGAHAVQSRVSEALRFLLSRLTYFFYVVHVTDMYARAII